MKGKFDSVRWQEKKAASSRLENIEMTPTKNQSSHYHQMCKQIVACKPCHASFSGQQALKSAISYKLSPPSKYSNEDCFRSNIGWVEFLQILMPHSVSRALYFLSSEWCILLKSVAYKTAKKRSKSSQKVVDEQ